MGIKGNKWVPNIGAFAADTNQTIKINSRTLTFNHIYYVDINNGDDTTGNGTQEKPFKTFYKAYGSCSNSDAVFLNPGTYSLSLKNGVALDLDKNISIIGSTKAQTILTDDGLGSTGSADFIHLHSSGKTYIYNIIFKSSMKYKNFMNIEYNNSGLHLYNCITNVSISNIFSYWGGVSSFTNCDFISRDNQAINSSMFVGCAFNLNSIFTLESNTIHYY